MSEVPDQAARIAAGPRPSDFLPSSGQPDDTAEPPFDPLKLCIFATIAMLGWIFGPVAVVVFAVVGFVGYWKAHQAGLTRSKCYLRDTRLVLAYLAVFVVAGLVGVGLIAARWLGWA
jgi:mannose/fructose/N-acetylgalactosamine-specific phosphotransferase system component IID